MAGRRWDGVASYFKIRRCCPDAVAGDAGDAGFLDVAGSNQAWRWVSYTDTESSAAALGVVWFDAYLEST